MCFNRAQIIAMLFTWFTYFLSNLEYVLKSRTCFRNFYYFCTAVMYDIHGGSLLFFLLKQMLIWFYGDAEIQ